MLSSFYQYFSLTSPSTEVDEEAKESDLQPITGDPCPSANEQLPLTAGSEKEEVTRSSLASSSAADLRRLIVEAGRPASLGDSGVANSGSDGGSSGNVSVLAQHDDATAISLARATISRCHIDVLVEETKFLMDDSLQEFIKVMRNLH